MAYKVRLRKVGGSVMLAIPPALLDALDFSLDIPVDLEVNAGRLVVEPAGRKRYSLDELLARCNPKARRRAEDKDWVAAKPVGRELI